MTERQYVGHPAGAVDGLDKIRGQAKFVGDYQLPGMLHTRVLRSQVPHARIVRLDVSPALKVPGVVAAITAKDFVDHSLWGWPIKEQYILAYSKVLYVGQGVAAVAAETAEAARAGIEAIELELEELPAVFDPDQALAPGALQVPLESPTGQGNLCETIIVRYGEPDPILQACAVLYEETFHTGRQEHDYLEPEAALAIPQPDGSVTVHYNGQSPFINQSHLTQVLGLPAEKVRIIQPVVGGSFGGKDDLGYQTSGQVAALALKTGRPVKLVLGREESMIASYKREPMAIRFKLGADAEGNLQAAKVEMLADSGCFSSMTTLAMLRASLHAAGAYRYQAVHVDTQAVYTNNGFSGAFRGFGNTDAAAAIEQAIDDLAHRLGRDPIDYRLQNCVRQGDRFMSGNAVEHEVKLPAQILKFAGVTMCDTKRLRDWLGARAEATTDPQIKAGYEELYEKVGRLQPVIGDREELIKVACAIQELDEAAGLGKFYDRLLLDPLSTVFNTEKVADEMIELAGRQVPLEQLLQVEPEVYRDVFGPDLADEFIDGDMIDPEQLKVILPTVPFDLQRTLAVQMGV